MAVAQDRPTNGLDPSLPRARALLEEAGNTVCGDRQASYGHPAPGFEQIAKVWSAIIGFHITPRQVCQMMIGLKVCRDSNSYKHDNLVDIVGYAILAEEVEQ